MDLPTILSRGPQLASGTEVSGSVWDPAAAWMYANENNTRNASCARERPDSEALGHCGVLGTVLLREWSSGVSASPLLWDRTPHWIVWSQKL